MMMEERLTSDTFQQARLSRDRRFDGRFFVAVKSTGIFCRNICPAKTPKEENVEYFDCAAQAVTNGYRPCLRCRPDSAPQSYAWLGAETTLIRAMRILKEFPEQSLQEISNRLGVSDRYLRKLFQERLGLSPKQYQISEQLMFAKKLLHESQLPVEQIAASVGFGSARRLQDNLKQTMQLTPSQIRSSNQEATSHIRIYLSVTPPYNWQQVRDFWRLRAAKRVEQVTDNSYARNFLWEGVKGCFIATYQENAHRFEVQIALDNVARLRSVVANIRRILDVDTDIQTVEARLLDTHLPESALISGVRLPGVFTLFEAATRAVLGQQVSVKAAINHVNQLVDSLGVDFINPLGVHDLDKQFPEPHLVAKSDLAFFRMPGARKQALVNLAKFVTENPESPPDEWLPLKGIGPWTINYAKMRGLSDPDIWLGTDLVIKKQIEKFDLATEKATPWRSYLTFQLWTHA